MLPGFVVIQKKGVGMVTAKPDTGLKAVDSLSAYEFRVELNGATVSGIFGVRGLSTFRLEDDIPPLTIAKMVQQNPALPFNVWTTETLRGHRPTRDIAIVAVDEGVETRRWIYKDAYIVAIDFSDFDTASSELIEERVMIKATSVEEIWP
jgi:hypothetical protein